MTKKELMALTKAELQQKASELKVHFNTKTTKDELSTGIMKALTASAKPAKAAPKTAAKKPAAKAAAKTKKTPAKPAKKAAAAKAKPRPAAKPEQKTPKTPQPEATPAPEPKAAPAQKFSLSGLLRKKKDELFDILDEMGQTIDRSVSKIEVAEIVQKATRIGQDVAKQLQNEQPKAEEAIRKAENSLKKLAKKVEDIFTASPSAPETVKNGSMKNETEESKYQSGATQRAVKMNDEDLPFPQWAGETMLILLPRDERWIFATWEIDWETRKSILGEDPAEQLLLQIYDMGPLTDPVDDPSVTTVILDENSDNWFIDTGADNHILYAELGYKVKGEFKLLARSNKVCTAPARESDDTSVYFVRIEQDKPLKHLAAMIKQAGRDSRDIALNLDALGLAVTPPEGYAGSQSAKLDALYVELRRSIAQQVPGSLFSGILVRPEWK